MNKKFLLPLLCLALTVLSACGGGGGGGSSGNSSNTPSSSSNYVKSIQTWDLNNGEYPKLMTADATGNVYVAVTGSNAAIYNNSDRIAKFDGAHFSTYLSVGRPYALTFVDPANVSSGFYISAQPNGSNPGIYDSTLISVDTQVGAGYGGVLYASNRVFWANQTTSRVVSDTNSHNFSVTQAPAGIAIKQGAFYVTRSTLVSSGTSVCAVQVLTNTSDVHDFACSSSQFNRPQGIAYSSQVDAFYVVNSGGSGTVVRIDASGNVDATPFLTSADGLCAPVGAVVVGNYLYVSNGPCTSGANHVNGGFILRVNLS